MIRYMFHLICERNLISYDHMNGRVDILDFLFCLVSTLTLRAIDKYLKKRSAKSSFAFTKHDHSYVLCEK